MKFDWNPDKNKILKATRGIGFESIVRAVKGKRLLVDTFHHNRVKYPRQKLLIVKIRNYAYVVPYIQHGTTKFLKTIYPSRDYYKKYLKNDKKD